MRSTAPLLALVTLALSLALLPSPVHGDVHLPRTHKFLLRRAAALPHRKPQCGPTSSSSSSASSSSSSTYDALNYGVTLDGVGTILSFGDSLSDCGASGATSGGTCGTFPTTPPSLPSSGPIQAFLQGRRVSSGPTWVELLAQRLDASLLNFAASGATVSRTVVAASRETNDLTSQLDLFGRHRTDAGATSLSTTKTTTKTTTTPATATTLCTFFFGTNDAAQVGNVASGDEAKGAKLGQAATALVEAADKLGDTCSETLFVDLQKDGAYRDTLQEAVTHRGEAGSKTAYVNLSAQMAEVEADLPRYGLSQLGPCIDHTDGSQWTNKCADAAQVEKTLYYLGHHPNGVGQKVMEAFVVDAIQACGGGGNGHSDGSGVGIGGITQVGGNDGGNGAKGESGSGGESVTSSHDNAKEDGKEADKDKHEEEDKKEAKVNGKDKENDKEKDKESDEEKKKESDEEQKKESDEEKKKESDEEKKKESDEEKKKESDKEKDEQSAKEKNKEQDEEENKESGKKENEENGKESEQTSGESVYNQNSIYSL